MSDPQLSYALNPAEVALGETVMIRLTVSNGAATSLTINRQGDLIVIRLPAALSRGLEAVAATALTPGWSCFAMAGQAGQFVVRPLAASATLAAGDKVEVAFSGVVVNGSAGVAAVEGVALIGGAETRASTPLTISPAVLKVSAWANPSTVTQGKYCEINYTAIVATQVKLTPGKQSQTCAGIISRGAFKVMPPLNAKTTTYTLTASDARGGLANTTVTVTLGAPKFLKLAPTVALPAEFDKPLRFDWETEYADRVSVDPPGTTVTENTITFTPSTYLENPNRTVDVQFAAIGYGAPDRRKLTVDFHPPEIIYFARSSTDPSATPSFALFSARGQLELKPGSEWLLTVTGAGNQQLQRSLGAAGALECALFMPYAETFKAGTSVTIRFTANNAKAASLNGEAIPLNSKGEGTKTVTLTQTTDYLLVLTNAAGQTLKNRITLTVA